VSGLGMDALAEGENNDTTESSRARSFGRR
jgi:hypothetical protein